MKILLTNDDGYKAAGINSLAKHLSSLGHKITMIAPSAQRSAQSHAMSFYNAVQVDKISEHVYAVNGTPADCVAIGLGKIMKNDPPDLVVSGTNHGLNVGIDVNYSGTVGAATEGALIGYRAIAVSADITDLSESQCEEIFLDAAKLTGRVLEYANSIQWPKLQVININVPFKSKGVKLAECGGESLYIPNIEEISSETQKNTKLYLIGGTERFAPMDFSQDVSLVSSGYSTLSFIQTKQSSQSNVNLENMLNNIL